MTWKSQSGNKAVNIDMITFWYMDTGNKTMHINGSKFAYNSEAEELWEILKSKPEEKQLIT